MRLGRTLLGLVFVAATAACYSYGYVPVGGEVVVTSAPYGAIESGPYVYYGGRQHYYYHHHWYFRDANGNWYYYPHEPYELHEYRKHHHHHYDD